MHPNPTPPSIVRQLIEESRKEGHQTLYLRPQEISLFLLDNPSLYRRSKPLQLNILFVRGISGPLSIEQFLFRGDILRVFEENNVMTINSSKAIQVARDKLLTSIFLKKKGILVPKSVLTEDLNQALKIVEEWGRVLVKPLVGSLGRGIIMLDDPDIAYPILKQLLSWSQPILLQEYIEKPGNRDLRVLVINGEVYASYYRVGKEGSFKTNVAQGARIEPVEIGEEVREIAVKATETLGLFYAGVDLVETPNGYVVLEANASPNWKGAIILGKNPAKKLVREAVKSVRK